MNFCDTYYARNGKLQSNYDLLEAVVPFFTDEFSADINVNVCKAMLSIYENFHCDAIGDYSIYLFKEYIVPNITHRYISDSEIGNILSSMDKVESLMSKVIRLYSTLIRYNIIVKGLYFNGVLVAVRFMFKRYSKQIDNHVYELDMNLPTAKHLKVQLSSIKLHLDLIRDGDIFTTQEEIDKRVSVRDISHDTSMVKTLKRVRKMYIYNMD